MGPEGDTQEQAGIRWRYLWLAALVFLLAMALMGGLWHLSGILPGWGQAGPTATTTPQVAATPSLRATTPPAQPRALLLQPTLSGLEAEDDEGAGTLTLRMAAEVPAGRQIDQVWLWYGSEAGCQVRRISGPFSSRTAISRRLDLAREGLTRTLTTTYELDYWWLVLDTAGDVARAGGRVSLSPALQVLIAPPSPEPAGIEPTWVISQTEHFRFYYLAGSAAERDRHQIGGLAESALDQIESALETEFDGQMSIYLVPRVFWQGGAAYGNKVQLISYLDRNYTGVEIWSYFTHEGTHALAQDLLQPKEEDGGGPDGVLVEGLAVWVSGGHYRLEPLDAWAAVVAASDDYIPLADLRAGPFYDYQHETSYLEGASFVKYLVENYGLERFKELYGLATGKAAHDGLLVDRLYGRGYDELEAEWLDYLAGLEPTPQQADTWQLTVRSFEVMRRYQTDLDPDARILPSLAPTEWTSDTYKIFTTRLAEPVNLVLETALIAAQERLHGGDLEGARLLLDDIEVALDAGGALDAGSLEPRSEIVDLIAAQDRAVLVADAAAYRDTLSSGSGLASDRAVWEALAPPFATYYQELVRLDLTDETHAEALVRLHVKLAEGAPSQGGASHDGGLARLLLARTPDGWQVFGREPVGVTLTLPALRAD
jgi:hypothetical protein